MEQCLNCFLKTFTFFPITCRNINLFYVQSIANWMKRRTARLFVLPSYQSLTFRLSAILLHVVNGEDRIRRRWYTRRELYLIHIILLFPFYFQKFISSISLIYQILEQPRIKIFLKKLYFVRILRLEISQSSSTLI